MRNLLKIINNHFPFAVIIILIISIYPWSIKEFIRYTLQNSDDRVNNTNVSVIPNELSRFLINVKKYITANEKILFISENGEAEKEFFMISYYLYPAKVLWISNRNKDSISWWNYNNLSKADVFKALEANNINWVISYNYPIQQYGYKMIIEENKNILKLFKVDLL